MTMTPIVTIIPVKDTRYSKQRTAAKLGAAERQQLALTMLEDVLAAVQPTGRRAQMVLVTVDPAAIALAEKYGATTTDTGADDGHTGSVTAAAKAMARAGAAGFLTLPGDIPLVATSEVEQLLDAHQVREPAFTIAPSHDKLGSNAVACSPVGAVALRFGDDSFGPHLSAARANGIEPTVLELPGIAQDIDTPADIERFLTLPQARYTRTYAYLMQRPAPVAPSLEGQV